MPCTVPVGGPYRPTEFDTAITRLNIPVSGGSRSEPEQLFVRRKRRPGSPGRRSFFVHARADQLHRLAFLPLVRQEFEQHWLFDVQLEFGAPHWQAGSELQAPSAQSIWELQLSSTPLPQVSLGAAQSVAQFEQFSEGWQVSLPQQ